MGNSASGPLAAETLAWLRGTRPEGRGVPGGGHVPPSSLEAGQPPVSRVSLPRKSRRPLLSDFSLQRCRASCFLI